MNASNNSSTNFTMATQRIISRLQGRFATSGNFIRDFSFYSFAFLTWIPAAAFFNMHIADIAVINGPSMSPYLNRDFDSSDSKDICVVKKWNAKEGLERGMIVALRFSNPYQHHWH
jgi:signal peptidase I